MNTDYRQTRQTTRIYGYIILTKLDNLPQPPANGIAMRKHWSWYYTLRTSEVRRLLGRQTGSWRPVEVTSMSKYSQYIERGKRQHGDKFSETALAQQFVPYYNSGTRVRVAFSDGQQLTGTIGATTGWGPCFLLMRTARSIGSIYTLGTQDRVVAVQQGRQYRMVQA